MISREMAAAVPAKAGKWSNRKRSAGFKVCVQCARVQRHQPHGDRATQLVSMWKVNITGQFEQQNNNTYLLSNRLIFRFKLWSTAELVCLRVLLCKTSISWNAYWSPGLLLNFLMVCCNFSRDSSTWEILWLVLCISATKRCPECISLFQNNHIWQDV